MLPTFSKVSKGNKSVAEEKMTSYKIYTEVQVITLKH